VVRSVAERLARTAAASPSLQRFDPVRIVHTLHHTGLRFVLVGGLASVIHGSPRITADADVMYHATETSLAQLAKALTALRAIPIDAATSPPQFTAVALMRHPRYPLLEFTTDAGALDCDDYGRERFDQVVSRAVSVELSGLPVLVAAMDDLIELKRQAGRPKDMRDVHLLTLVRGEAGQDPAITSVIEGL
jgi:Nucleotidyl transferase AbiEii toxin, Type IV TA system